MKTKKLFMKLAMCVALCFSLVFNACGVLIFRKNHSGDVTQFEEVEKACFESEEEAREVLEALNNSYNGLIINIPFHVHDEGDYFWRYRGIDITKYDLSNENWKKPFSIMMIGSACGEYATIKCFYELLTSFGINVKFCDYEN